MTKRNFLVGFGLLALVVIFVSACSLVSASSDNNSQDDVEQPAPAVPTPTATSELTATQPPAAQPNAPVLRPSPPPGPDTPVSSGPLPPPGATVPPASNPPTPPAQPEPGMQAVLAPIDGVDIIVRESFPPQYGLHVMAGLPSGCAKRFRHDVTRDGNVINVSVLNTIPTGAVACTAIYGMYEINIVLGSDFQSGVVYTVNVNDVTKTFTAQ